MRLPSAAARQLVSFDWQSLADRIPEHNDRCVTYSRKVFIPLTRLCQDSCGYCTFALHEGTGDANAYLTPDEILEIARRGADAGCTEALFTLGDRPEKRWPVAAEELKRHGHESTVDYLADVAQQVLDQTGLLPHTNPGLLNAREMARLRAVTASQGLMLETFAPAAAHAGCKTKAPRLRLRQLELAGRLSVPFTTGLLLGLGETREDTIDALLAIRRSHERWGGHVQEVIVQPFRPKEGTRMAEVHACPEEELLWAVAAATLLLGPSGIAIQSPPNLSADPTSLRRLLRCGVRDWGGVSPGVTIDHVNPEAAWPEVAWLREHTEAAGLQLVPRLPAYPRYCAHRSVQTRSLARWQHPAVAPHVRRLSDADGYARTEGPAALSWHAGLLRPPPSGEDEADHHWLPFGAGHAAMRHWRPHAATTDPAVSAAISADLAGAVAGGGLSLRQMERLLRARGPDLAAVCLAADSMRRQRVGPDVSFVVCRNINCAAAYLGARARSSLDVEPATALGGLLWTYGLSRPSHPFALWAGALPKGVRGRFAPLPRADTNKCVYACTFCAFSKGTPKGPWKPGGSAMKWRCRRSAVASRRHGRAGRPRYACKAASPARLTAPATRRSCARRRTRSRASTCMHSRRSRSRRVRARAA